MNKESSFFPTNFSKWQACCQKHKKPLLRKVQSEPFDQKSLDEIGPVDSVATWLCPTSKPPDWQNLNGFLVALSTTLKPLAFCATTASLY